MVNNYNLEWELLRRNRVTEIFTKTIMYTLNDYSTEENKETKKSS